MSPRYMAVALLGVALGLAACGSPPAERSTSMPRGAGQPTTLVMVVNIEVKNLTQKAVGDTNPARTTRIFNAGLTVVDSQDNVHPYLAQVLPQLNTDTWHVFPDGRMETTWRLRPNLTWHGGQPLTADDFVFALGVYQAPDLRGFFGPRPQDIVERIEAVDPQTIRIFWRSPSLHQGEGLDPLPRHILAEPFAAFQQDSATQRDAFLAQRFWTTEYVGAGPYKLTSWEPASHIEGEAFEGHALGRPRIDRVLIRLISDENTVLANMMAGEMHLSMAQALRFEDAMILQRQGGFNDAERKGRVLLSATSTATVMPQMRAEYQQSPAIFDLRVRQALAYATDKEAINEGIYQGQTQVPLPNSWVNPGAPYYLEVERAITRYPYDLRRVEQLMSEAGYAKGLDGFFGSSGGERFQPDLWHTGGAQKEKVLTVVADTWRRAGIHVQPHVMGSALERDQQTRATYSGVFINSLGLSEATSFSSYTSEEIGTPANRWRGQNRGGWSNPEYDLLWERYNRTLDRAEQIQAFVQAMKLRSDHIPSYPLHYSLNAVTHVAPLRGPDGHASHWNIHEWELVR